MVDLSHNQYVNIGNGIQGILEGRYSALDIIVRIKIPDNKQDERNLKQFTCLTRKATISRLYLIPEKHLMRHNEQTRQTLGVVKKKSRPSA